MSLRTENTRRKIAPIRADGHLFARKISAVSRGALQRLMEQGHILVNGHTVKPTHSPRAGEQIEVRWPEAMPAEAQPEEIPLAILFEPIAARVEQTRRTGCAFRGRTRGTHARQRPAAPLPGFAQRHRRRRAARHRASARQGHQWLPRLAKNDETHLALSSQFAKRQVKKIYNAIVCGELARASGEIRVAIARHPSHRKRMAARDDDSGRAAHTSYRVLERLNAATLVEAQIHTGPHPPGSRAFSIHRPPARWR